MSLLGFEPRTRGLEVRLRDVHGVLWSASRELEAAGLLTVGFEADGTETWTLTPEGVQVARQPAMGDATAFDAILDATEPTPPE